MKVGNIEVYGIIYKITNKKNGKVYIGQTTRGFKGRYPCKGKGIERVYNTYVSNKKSGGNSYNNHLLSAINKDGVSMFEVSETFDIAFSLDELNIKEKLYIKQYNSTNSKYGYNRCEGGGNGLHSKDSKLKQGNKIMCLNNGKTYISYFEAEEQLNTTKFFILKRLIKPWRLKKDLKHDKKKPFTIEDWDYLRFVRVGDLELKVGESICRCCGKIFKLTRKKTKSTRSIIYAYGTKYCKDCSVEVARKLSRDKRRASRNRNKIKK